MTTAPISDDALAEIERTALAARDADPKGPFSYASDVGIAYTRTRNALHAAASPDAVLSLIARLRAAEAERDALRVVLTTHGHHRHDCDSLRRAERTMRRRPCNYGLGAALREDFTEQQWSVPGDES